MSGVAVQLRQRAKANARPSTHRTKANTARVMRNAALSMLRAPYCDDELAEHAGTLLDHVGELLVLPRAGWYPRRPQSWRP